MINAAFLKAKALLFFHFSGILSLYKNAELLREQHLTEEVSSIILWIINQNFTYWRKTSQITRVQWNTCFTWARNTGESNTETDEASQVSNTRSITKAYRKPAYSKSLQLLIQKHC